LRSGLLATPLPARYRAAVVPFDRGSYHAAVVSRADPDATWTDADGDVRIIPPAISVTVPVPSLRTLREITESQSVVVRRNDSGLGIPARGEQA